MRFGKSESKIAEGTFIEGDIDCEQELLVSGTVKGNIRCGKKLVVAQNGKVFGNIFCDNMDVSGSIEGNIDSSGLLVLESQSVVLGKISSHRRYALETNFSKIQKH